MDKKINSTQLITKVLGNIRDRERDVLLGRYGLNQPATLTLAKIGSKYDITRERVRQIEALGLATVRESLSKNDDVALFTSLVTNYLKNMGGAVREDRLVDEVRRFLFPHKNAEIQKNQIRFLLEASGKFKFSREDGEWHSFWYLGAEDKKKAQALVQKIIPLYEGKRAEIVREHDGKSLVKTVAKENNIEEAIVENYIALSKKFGANSYGDFGLSHWPEIKPKTARDWAHLVLRKEKKPMHFTHIAKVVNTLRKDRPVHHQTVHNELIKDSNFVLVGKGMYGLKEFGLVPGTAREVIARFLKQHGPLRPQELTGLILKERFFKPNTILVNLQNKKHFERLPNGQYTIREA